MSPILTGVIASGISGHLTPPWDGPEGGYDALASVTLSTSANKITFSGIPSGYKHLQLRFSATTTRNTYAVSDPFITFNDDAIEGGSNYTTHYMRGDGATAVAGSVTPGWRVYAPGLMSTNQAAGPAVGIIDILDYSDSTKYTTVRWLGGFDTNGTVAGYGGFIGLVSGAWKNTAPVNSIQFSGDYVPYLANSKFSLYGVK